MRLKKFVKIVNKQDLRYSQLREAAKVADNLEVWEMFFEGSMNYHKAVKYFKNKELTRAHKEYKKQIDKYLIKKSTKAQFFKSASRVRNTLLRLIVQDGLKSK